MEQGNARFSAVKKVFFARNNQKQRVKLAVEPLEPPKNLKNFSRYKMRFTVKRLRTH